MSYSRWSNSSWYTYYCASESLERDEQLFDVCAIKAFTYRDLKDNLQGCLDGLKADQCKDATQKELEELKGYMLEFIDDVESNVEINEYESLKNLPLEDLPLYISTAKSENVREWIASKLRGEIDEEDNLNSP